MMFGLGVAVGVAGTIALVVALFMLMNWEVHRLEARDE